MDEYINKQKVIDYLNDYLHSLGEGSASTLLYNRGQRRALTNAIQDISAVKAADVQPTKWVSVEDRLPEPEKDVLVWYRYTWGAGFTSYRFGISKWYSNIKRWYEGCLPKDIEVLYWQPLPEPPQD